MRRFVACVLGALTMVAAAHAQESSPKVAIAIHGGAGTISREEMTPAREAEYREKLTEALRAGHARLEEGAYALDAVVAAIQILEDSPLFNAARGAVFTSDGANELDAAIMDGRTLSAGAVSGIRHIAHPIDLARLVMERSKHVMLYGEGAEEFALEQGMSLVPQSYFFTQRRWDELEKAREEERQQRESTVPESGTVGAVALDARGNLAAGTSTGGLTNKRFGRIGDTPIIGAGTYADNASCAVSGTGHGEYFMRSVVGHDIAALMRYKGLTVEEAADEVVMEKLVQREGEGGVIALDAEGNIAMPFNTPGMYRGYIDTAGRLVVKIYADE
ncbi:MAG: isoaspartyl peptidase/L-asparaginase family protein [Gammaproteobacteria bacterium]